MPRPMETIKRWGVNRLGWKSNRTLLVIESDDWGMVRVASLAAYRRLQAKGYPVDECPYNRYDTLESAADLDALSETLAGFRDHTGRPAVVTANMVMGNPDFDAIRSCALLEYQAQPFWQTLQAYGQDSAVESYRQARAAGVLRPQLHGRDHVDVGRWLHALQHGDVRFADAFAENMFTVHPGGATSCHRDLLDALGSAPTDQAFPQVVQALAQAQAWFTEFWGAPSRSFIAPCYTWHAALEPALQGLGVRYLQGSRVQRVPLGGPKSGIQPRWHFTGQRNAHGQRYVVRNVSLEPAIVGAPDECVDQALVEVAAAFRQRTPAVVSSHRLNYIGGLDESNRVRGLQALARFLRSVQKRWPEVEFVSTEELGRLMEA